jgi:hypothetical protein
MSTTALVLGLVLWLETAATVVLLVLAAAASLEAFAGLCLGCENFRLGMRARDRLPRMRGQLVARARERASYRTTTFTSRPGTTIVFTTCLPSTCARTFGAASASSMSSSLSAAAGASSRSRTLPLT